MADNQTIQDGESKGKRGGFRENAGRKGLVKSLLRDERFCKARGIDPLYASEILAHVIDEKRAWQRVFMSQDERVVLQALMFLTQMRDGKASQRIEVNATTLMINASEIERARAIVAEIRGDLPASVNATNHSTVNDSKQASVNPLLLPEHTSVNDETKL